MRAFFGAAPALQGKPMHRVLILGAGKIGALISGLLAESGSYQVDLGDVDGSAADSVVRAHGSAHLAGFAVDAVRDHGKARLHLLRYTAEGKA